MRVGGISGIFTAALFVAPALSLLFAHPDTPLPPQWNPTAPLAVAHPVTALTGWKLSRTARDGDACIGALQEAEVRRRPDFVSDANPLCGIENRVSVTRVGGAQVREFETTCAVALRLAMWERHSLQPAATELLGARVARIRHLDSYSCRPIRTSAGDGGRLSTHATAEAVDISGFDMADGRRITLIDDWGEGGDAARFLSAARDGACRWFATALGPDYNTLHRDHFHLQSRGWGLCR